MKISIQQMFHEEGGELLGELEQALLQLEQAPQAVEPVGRIFRLLHTLKGSAAMAGFATVARLAHELESIYQEVREGRLPVDRPLISRSLETWDGLRQLLVHPTGGDADSAGERLFSSLREFKGGVGAAERLWPSAAREENDGVVIFEGWERSAAGEPGKPAALSTAIGEMREEVVDSIRIRSQKLNALVDLAGELVIVQSRLSQTSAKTGHPGLGGIAEEMDRLIGALREQVLDLRMLPVGTAFRRFRRLVRDLAQELGKEVEWVTEGVETELDKNILDRLQEPLLHLIRNAVDHGIERRDIRLRSGKPAQGRVRLTATNKGTHIVLELNDDGAGLNLEALRTKAACLGLVPAATELSEQEQINLIFHPGLSTAHSLSDISGRGVGMDVVKRTIETLCGKLSVVSLAGKGTTFTLRLPLTMAIIEGLLVQVGAEHFVLPLAEVEQCIELQRETRNHRRDLIRMRDQLVPYVFLREIFAIAGDGPEIQQVIIAGNNGRRVGLVVDHVVGSHQTVLKPLGNLFSRAVGMTGATVLGDGRVALVLDVARLVEAMEGEEA